jgi:hypothetical protein
MKIVIGFLMMLAGCIVNAEEYVYLGGWSHHFSDHPKSGMTDGYEPPANHQCWRASTCITGEPEYVEYKYNENHHMIGYQKNSYLLAHFKNSFNQNTWVLDKQFTITKKGNFTFLASLGITYGYTDCDFEDKGTKAEFCPHYQAGFAYTKYKIEPVISFGANHVGLAFRLKL